MLKVRTTSPYYLLKTSNRVGGLVSRRLHCRRIETAVFAYFTISKTNSSRTSASQTQPLPVNIFIKPIQLEHSIMPLSSVSSHLIFCHWASSCRQLPSKQHFCFLQLPLLILTLLFSLNNNLVVVATTMISKVPPCNHPQISNSIGGSVSRILHRPRIETCVLANFQHQ